MLVGALVHLSAKETLALRRLWTFVCTKDRAVRSWADVFPLSEDLALAWYCHLIENHRLQPASALASGYSARRGLAVRGPWPLKDYVALKRLHGRAIRAAVAAGHLNLSADSQVTAWSAVLQRRLHSAAATAEDRLVMCLAAICYLGGLRLGDVISPPPFVPGLHTRRGDASFGVNAAGATTLTIRTGVTKMRQSTRRRPSEFVSFPDRPELDAPAMVRACRWPGKADEPLFMVAPGVLATPAWFHHRFDALCTRASIPRQQCKLSSRSFRVGALRAALQAGLSAEQQLATGDWRSTRGRDRYYRPSAADSQAAAQTVADHLQASSI